MIASRKAPSAMANLSGAPNELLCIIMTHILVESTKHSGTQSIIQSTDPSGRPCLSNAANVPGFLATVLRIKSCVKEHDRTRCVTLDGSDSAVMRVTRDLVRRRFRASRSSSLSSSFGVASFRT
jgi:hypothetical protein